MKHSLLIILLLFNFINLNAQIPEAKQLNIVLVMPQYVEGLEYRHIEHLESALANLLTSNGVTSASLSNGIAIIPKLQLLEQRSVNAGVQNMIVIEADLILTIKQPSDQMVFGSITKRLKAGGRNKEIAISSLIEKINADDPLWYEFLNKSRQKVLSYYNSSCEKIISRANDMTKTNQFAEALGLLMAIPQESNCYTKSRTGVEDLFKKYQIQNCKTIIQVAQAQMAARQFTESLATLSMIDPLSPCAQQTQQLIEKGGQQTSADNQQSWETLKKMFADNANLEKYRLQLINSFLLSHYNKNPYSYEKLR